MRDLSAEVRLLERARDDAEDDERALEHGDAAERGETTDESGRASRARRF